MQNNIDTPASFSTKKLHIETWGCQMNVADSERMFALLALHGYESVPTPHNADLIILNTCNIREKARHKVLTRLGELKMLKNIKPHLVLAVSGCVAQVEAEQLAKELPFVDIIFGPDHIEDLPRLLSKAIEKKADAPIAHSLVESDFSSSTTYSIPFDVAEPWMGESQEPSRFVNIIKGCNNFCTYCVVPYTRGREKSRSTDEIEQEIRYLIEHGVKEIVLLGQNVNSYGLDFSFAPAVCSSHFIELLFTVSKIPGVERLRFVTSNPHDFPDELPAAFAQIPSLCDQLHLPVQSGSDKILASMNRKYTRSWYLDKLAKLRAVRPNIAISSDFIVGFPGETDADFEETLSLAEQVKFSFIFAFKYSPRKLTKAAGFLDQIPEAVKDARLQRLLALQKAETFKQHLALVGQHLEVFIVYRSRKHPEDFIGRTFAGHLVRVKNVTAIIGQNLRVVIDRALPVSLEAVVAE